VDARVFVSVFAYTLGRTSEDPAQEVREELAALEKANWPAFRTLARVREQVGHIALTVDHGSLIAKARSRAAAMFLQSGAEMWVSIDEDVDASAKDVAMLLYAMSDADIVVAPMPIRDGSRLNVTTNERSVRSVGLDDVRLFAIDHGGVALAAISRTSIETMASAFPELVYTDDKGIEGIGLFLEVIRGHKWWGEDTMFCSRARSCGLRTEALLDAHVVHMGQAPTSIDPLFTADEPETRREGMPTTS